MTHANGKNNKLKQIAVILIPGIGGSNITDINNKNNSWYSWKKGFGANLKREMVTWLSSRTFKARESLIKGVKNWQTEERSDKLEKINWKETKLFDIGNSEHQESRDWHQVASIIYEPFMKDCQGKNNGLPFSPQVYAIGYNFLQSNSDSGVDVMNRTKTIMERDQWLDGYIYVTHSMGALPARFALKKMKDNQDEKIYNQCFGVVHIAAPQLGSPVVYRRFLEGVQEDLVSNLVLGRTGAIFSAMASAIPSMFEILPVKSSFKEVYVDGKVPDIADVVYTIVMQSWKKHDVAQQCAESARNYMKQAKEFHEKLDNYFFENTAAIVLKGLETTNKIGYSTRKKLQSNNEEQDEIKEEPENILFSEIPLNFQFGTTAKDGDTSVLIASQSYGVIQNNIYESEGVSHADPLKYIGKKKGVFDLIYKALDNLYKDALKEKTTAVKSFSVASNFIGKEPVILNGEKVIFDKAIATTPVTIEPKTTHRQLYINKKSY